MSPQARFDATSLGEALLRLSVRAGVRLAQAEGFDVRVAGAEMNVCAALANLSRTAGLVTALPNNDLGELVLRKLREVGVDTEAVTHVPESRMGTYYVELSSPPRPIRVIYDRQDSAASRLTPDSVDWDYLLDTRILHLSGITPALSDSCRSTVEEALRRARDNGVPVSFDVNYRGKLWSPGEAASWCDENVRETQLLLCAERDARSLFGLEGSAGEVIEGLWRRLRPDYAILSSGGDAVLVYDGTELVRYAAVPAQIVDRLGAGDALAAGVIDGWLDGDMAAGVQRGVVLAALALAQDGDQVVTNRAEVEGLIATARTEAGVSR